MAKTIDDNAHPVLTAEEEEASKFDPRAEDAALAAADTGPEEAAPEPEAPAAEADSSAPVATPAAAEPEAEEPEISAAPDTRSRLRDMPATPEVDRITELDQIEAELVAKLDDGEISNREYHEAMRTVNGEREDLRWAMREREIEVKAANKAAETQWVRDIQSWMTRNKIDISKRLWLAAFDGAVKAVQSDPKNNGLSNTGVLDLARANLDAEMGITRAAPKAESAKPALAKKAAAVPTLANVGSNSPGAVDNGEFASLQRLMDAGGTEYEDAYSRLPASKREAFGRYIGG